MKRFLRLTMIAVLCAVLLGGLWITTPDRTAAQGSTWTVQVFNNQNLAGTPIWTGTTPNVNYTWGQGAPVINGVATGAPADNFSIRFETTTLFTAGSYRFTATYDDGVRLYIDGALLINDWTTGSQRTRQADFTFGADGNHVLRVEYFEATVDATILVSWAVAVGPTPTTNYGGTAWVGQFFSGVDLVGAPIYSGTYPPSGLSLNWGTGSPGGVVPVDNFSARFTRTINVPTDLPKGVYKFYAKADDNFRFWVDQTLVFDYWTVFEDGKVYTADITLLNGPHDLKFEYREIGVNAYLFLTWDPPLAQNPPLYPTGGGGAPVGTPIPGAQPGATAVPAVTATVTANVLNFRAEPSLLAQILAKLNKSAVYPVIGRLADNSWVQLSVNGVNGWVMARYVTFTGDLNTVPVVGGGTSAPPPGPVQARGITAGNLFIRQGPSSRTPQIGVIPWKATTDILGRDVTHTWYQVSYGGVVGWSYAPWIKLTEGAFELLPYTDGSSPVWAPPATEGVVVQAVANMRIRNGPGLQFPKISQAHWGNRVQVLARSTNRQWYKIKYGDVIGWTFNGGWKLIQGDFNSVPLSDQ
jgi:uncharacterized protein YraI